jgi:hypothetical protein
MTRYLTYLSHSASALARSNFSRRQSKWPRGNRHSILTILHALVSRLYAGLGQTPLARFTTTVLRGVCVGSTQQSLTHAPCKNKGNPLTPYFKYQPTSRLAGWVRFSVFSILARCLLTEIGAPAFHPLQVEQSMPELVPKRYWCYGGSISTYDRLHVRVITSWLKSIPRL